VKWNTQRKSVVAVLALAAAAFCVDRFVLGYGPRAANAAEHIPNPLAVASPDPDGPGPSAAPLVRTVSLTERVAMLAVAESEGPDGPTDAFTLPIGWAKLLSSSPTSADDTIAGASGFTLTSVILDPHGTRTAARINGRLIKLGQKIDGRTLLRIEGLKTFTAILAGPNGPDDEIRVPLIIGNNTLPADADAAPTGS
jgi:hypothetical protein